MYVIAMWVTLARPAILYRDHEISITRAHDLPCNHNTLAEEAGIGIL